MRKTGVTSSCAASGRPFSSDATPLSQLRASEQLLSTACVRVLVAGGRRTLGARL